MQKEGEKGEEVLKFVPYISTVDVSFWHELAKRKLEIYKLSVDPVGLTAHYPTGTVSVKSKNPMPPRLIVTRDSFLDKEHSVQGNDTFSPGILFNTNTIEQYTEIIKDHRVHKLNEVAKQIYDDIVSGAAIDNPSLLQRFFVISYSDLKKYKFSYIFGFPALYYPDSIILNSPPTSLLSSSSSSFTGAELTKLTESFQQLCLSSSKIDLLHKSSVFIVRRSTSSVSWLSRQGIESLGSDPDFYLAFIDPSSEEKNPGWPLRNILFLISHYHKLSKIAFSVISVRDSKNFFNSNSVVFSITLSQVSSEASAYKVTGYENKPTKKGPGNALNLHSLDLGDLMDPSRLASTAVGLNLQLMRWRLAPTLDLEKIASTKCLLFGAGTLGCNVARCLLGWGVTHITMIDNGKVSFSNPVRQSLFHFTDCFGGGGDPNQNKENSKEAAWKAEAAARELSAIYPGVKATGVVMSIPMPGHSVDVRTGGEESVSKDYDQICSLVQSHDVIFMLTDSREARWLPTILGQLYNKLTINSALGFDTFLVMRHGMYKQSNKESNKNENTNPRLGCYFCNDIVAPTDSLKDRTLDQQCTVTRPGVSYVAGTIAVELLVSLLNHPKGAEAAAEASKPLSESPESVLGLVPHQIRGFLSHFQNMLIQGTAYDRCTACSELVVEKLRKEGVKFVIETMNNSKILEEVTGLAELQKQETDSSIDWDISDDEI